MKKRLCLFMMSLLLVMSVGCSRTVPQTTETFVRETPQDTVESVTTIESNKEDSLNTEPHISDSGIADFGIAEESSSSAGPAADSADDHPNITKEDPLPDSDAGESDSAALPEDGSYTSKEDVALYIHLYGHLPPNFITKKEAEKLGWKGGSLEPFAPGMCIGGSFFGNYEGLLPQKDGRSYTECDIDTLGADKRGARRIVFSNDGLIYYTEDHYASFELLYGEPDP